MRNLILHIGYSKTATTAIQEFLYSNKDILKEMGVNYPIFTDQYWRLPQVNGAFLFYYLQSRFDHDKTLASDIDENINILKKSIKDNNYTLVSEEGFSNYICSLDWDALSIFLKECGVQKLTVVVYLRRQDEFIASSWKQSVKVGATNLSFEDYVHSRNVDELLHYYSVIKKLDEGLNINHQIIVRPFDKNKFFGGSIFCDFCKTIGIDWDERFLTPNSIVNESLSFDAANAMLDIYCFLPIQNHYREIIGLKALELSNKYPDKDIMPFTSEGNKKFLKEYERENECLSKMYFNNQPFFTNKQFRWQTYQKDNKRIKEYKMTFLSMIPIKERIKNVSIYCLKRIKRIIIK